MEAVLNYVERTNVFALMLFPYASKQSARRLLTQLVRGNAALERELSAAGWETRNIFITRRAMEIILRHVT